MLNPVKYPNGKQILAHKNRKEYALETVRYDFKVD